MGAPVAYAYARLYPAAATRLAVLDVPLAGYGLDEFARRLHLWHFDFFREPGLAERFITGHERAFIEAFYPDYAPDALNVAARDEYARTYTRPGALAESLAYYRAFPQDVAWTQETAKPKLEIPALAVGGEFAGASAPFESLCQLAHPVTGRVLRDCGHYLAEEKPEALLAELLPFLETKEG